MPKVATKTQTQSAGVSSAHSPPEAPRQEAGRVLLEEDAGEQNREQRIREGAYRRFEARGGAPGDPAIDWLDAEAEVDGLAGQT